MGIERLLAGVAGCLPVVGSVGSLAEMEQFPALDGSIVVIMEDDLAPGGSLRVVARGVRGGRRCPVIALLDPVESPMVPYGFCQAAARRGGDSHALVDAVSAVSTGATYLGAELSH